jgi:hypothetical protein
VYFVSETAQVELKVDECKPLPCTTHSTAMESMLKSAQCQRRMSARRNGIAHHQGLTLLHFSELRKRFLWIGGHIEVVWEVFKG